ncbi:hypothetical protein TRICI_004232 [Trichomonascus ciferrii]|uniref:Uncharacterized protein n=1 Tax=Trichomonascus ciferrii TaxID=44093 RepID=A0A642V1L6_9ASCO|nr:hypothetical protein TRICI_004232 [Trichomonascus ciferrii]
MQSLAQTRLSKSVGSSTHTSPGNSPSDGFFLPSKQSSATQSGTRSPVLGISGQSFQAAAAAARNSRTVQPPSRATSPVPSSSIVEPRKQQQHHHHQTPAVASGPRYKLQIAEPTPQQPEAAPQKRPRRYSIDSKMFSDAAWEVEPRAGGNGGLRNAVYRAETEGRIGDKMWIGTLGMPTDALNGDKKGSIDQLLRNEYDCAPVFVDDQTFEGAYTHYCKQILWPTLHYQVPDDPKSKAYEDHSWGHYKRLNQAVADKIVEYHQEGDIVWINDYHLLLVPEMVRQKLPNAQIGLFLHVAFPSSEVFRCLACRKEILEGMLGANCVGFQIPEYTHHFLQTCNRILAVDTTPVGIRAEDKFVSVVSLSIGIDPPSLKTVLQDEEVQRWRTMIRERWPMGKKLIVARDKLDHIRGVKEKLLAYEEFLKTHPEWIENAVLIQVCLSNVADPELESEVTKIVDRISSLRTNLAGSQPVVFLQQDIEFQQYIALLAEADAFAVTSLREGMNLTCHEFVFCNDPKVQGPLILSEFTGAASLLGKYSLLVNPWDKKEMAQAFYQAVTMSKEERSDRWNQLYEFVTSNTSGEWVQEFVQFVEKSWEEDQKRKLNSLHRLDAQMLHKQYYSVPKGKKRLILMNLDRLASDGKDSAEVNPMYVAPHGAATATSKRDSDASNSSSTSSLTSSLVSGATSTTSLSALRTPASTYISPQRKISVLYELMSDPANIVYVISGEPRSSLELLFSRVNNVGLIAENGGYIRLFDDKRWVQLFEPDEWKSLVYENIQSLAERLPGSRIENNECSIVFYVNTLQDPDRASTIIGGCINHINDAFGNQKIRARLYEGGKVVITNEKVSKVAAAKYAYNHVHDDIGYMFLAAEGGTTEEDDRLFEWANQQPVDVCTVALGTTGTLAKWALEGVNGLLSTIMAALKAK